MMIRALECLLFSKPDTRFSWMSYLPQNRTFTSGNLYSHFRPENDLPGNREKAPGGAIIVVPIASSWSDSRVALSPAGKTPP
jgi:hypothetical protein